jgi:sulfite exporter TauE/SafE
LIEFSYFGAFLVGIMGAAHCFGMCGGLVGLFSSTLPKAKGGNLFAHQLGFLLSYNLGRISSYALAGALVGASTAAMGQLFSVDNYLIVLRLFAGVMMILTGLYIAKIWFGITKIERLGKYVWQYLSPLTQRFKSIKRKREALMAGMIWGWLPCGLVYSTLTWAVAAGSALDGALIMLCFGLGTLPALLSAGMAAKALANFVQQKRVRLASGGLLILFGLQTLYIAIMQLN